MQMQTRSFTCRATTAGDGRTLTAIGVPFNEETEIFEGYFETFAPGSISDEGAILRYAHSDPIGKITASQDTPAGREITGVISHTPRGDEIATLVADGVLTKMSIGFYPDQYTLTEDERGTHVLHTKVKAVEYSVVEFPAHPDSQINQIRTELRKAPEMSDTLTRKDLDPLTDAISTLEREIKMTRSQINEHAESQPARLEFRSIGEYAKALAGKLDREGAHEMAKRAFDGAVIGETVARPNWLGSIEKRMQAKQPVVSMFMHTYDLPAEGMTVEYAVHKGESSVAVAKQATEGANLVKGKPAAYEVKSAPVETYGGVGEMSIQAIERSTVNLLDDLLYDQAFMYAKQIETATRAQLDAATKTAEAAPLHSLAKITVNDLTDAVLALLDAYDDTPYLMDGIAVSTSVFSQLAHLDREPKALQFTGAPTDHQGTLTLPTAQGEFASVLVKRVPNWSGTHMIGYSQEAIRIKEAPGAPLRLQDGNILNLTKAFAVYGYAAIFTPKPDLIKAIKVGA